MAMVVLLRWLFVSAVIGAILSYNGVFDKLRKRSTEQTQQPLRVDPAEKTAKKKKARNKHTDRVASGTDSASAGDRKRKISNHTAGTLLNSAAITAQTGGVTREDDGGMGDKEFAQQFASRKEGINFTANKQTGSKSKLRTVKQSTADLDSPHLSAENSSTGQDGDDETTPAGSPAINAVSSSAAPDPTGVSDMLEPAKEGPKTLRLTGWEEAHPKKQKPAPKALEPVETKKQRQQRRKREEEKARIAESAREHQAKGQQQMRTARLADGTSNQTKANAFKAQSNAWTASQTQSVVKQPSQNSSVTPLDTFEPKTSTDVDRDGAVTTRSMSELQDSRSTATTVGVLKKEQGVPKTSALGASEREKAANPPDSLHRTQSWADQVMDEEEQMKWATDDPTAWEPVTTKKDKKKVRKAEEEISGKPTAVKQVNGHSLQIVTNGISSRAPTANKYKSLETDPLSNDLQDDDWEA